MNEMMRERASAGSLSFEPLSPIAFLRRSAFVFSDRTAIVDGDYRISYRELWDRAARFAGALRSLGVRNGDRVAILAPNTRALLEAHYAVAMAGAVLVALNWRLTAEELSYILKHSGAAVLVHDKRFQVVAEKAVSRIRQPPGLVNSGGRESDYERLVRLSDPVYEPVAREDDLISINYTSGTTGKPKGVMYHHRGAYLQALAMAFHAKLDASTVFLWTLPMFHCNGWCFTWAVTAAGGTHLCLPDVDAAEIWRLIREAGVTHLNAAPTVLTMIAYHEAAEDGPAARRILVGTGGAPPSPTLLARMADLNMEVTHLYGLTETFGPVTICEWWPEWSELDLDEQAKLKARQGVGNVISERMRVLDSDGRDVPADRLTLGEVALRGNNLMEGYYREPEATARASQGGWFRTGDLGVMHPDGYVELRDRAKDIIISGGENIASIEVEQAIESHPAVLECAVIAVPDDRWGEVPSAFVVLKEGAKVTETDITEHVRGLLAHFKAPKHVTFGPLPKTSTGKIQKFRLREAAWAGRERRIQ